MTATFFWEASSAFGAGILTSLSPCVYPMIPISLGYLGVRSTKSQVFFPRVLGFFAGQMLAFVALGISAVWLGQIFGFSSEIPAVQLGVGIFLVWMAYYSWREHIPRFLYRLNSLQSRYQPSTWLGAALVGISSAIVASPCTSPVLGGVLAAISQTNSMARGIILMTCYATGLSMVFLAIGLGLARLSQLPRAGLWMRAVHRLANFALAGTGLYFISRAITLI